MVEASRRNGVTSPAVVLVPGAWHTPAHYERLVRSVPDLNVRTVRLGSSGRDVPALGDMYGDAAEVQKAVSSIDGPVLVLAHSYGGVPASQALGTATENVRRIVYLASFPLDIGESMASLATQGGSLPVPPNWGLHEDEGYVEMTDPDSLFFDVEPALAQAAIDDLTYQSWSSLTQPMTNAAWRVVPSTYIVADEDRMLPVPAQELLAQRATEVLHISSSHSPFLSRPAELAAMLRAELARLG
jgi:pimeloyl-ACP methyl ester carboxylesterase